MDACRDVNRVRDAIVAERGVVSPLARYALGRIVTHLRVWDEAKWHDGVFADADRLESAVGAFYAAPSDDDRVRLALVTEYGSVLPSLSRTHFVLVEVPTVELVRPAADHQPTGHAAFDATEPVGMVAGSHRRRLLDGYHRVGSALAAEIPTVTVVWAVP